MNGQTVFQTTSKFSLNFLGKKFRLIVGFVAILLVIAQVKTVSAKITYPATNITPCATHTWINPDQGNITIRMIGPGNVVDVLGTPISQLTYDDGTIGYGFCTDILHGNFSPQQYCMDPNPFSDWRIAWLLANYPPSLTERVQQAARQAAVWTITNNFVLDSNDPTSEGSQVDTAVYSAYQTILNSIPSVEPPSISTTNLTLAISPSGSTLYLPGQTTIAMSAVLTQGGTPLQNVTVNLAVNDGGNGTTLTYTNPVTDSAGKIYFSLTNNSGTLYTANITATAQASVFTGIAFAPTDTSQIFQQLGTAATKTVDVQGQTNVTWAAASQIISVHKFEDINFNQIQDANEPNLANWNFQLTLPDQTTLTATTNASGDAYFYNATQFGTYTVTEIPQTGWINSTPLSVTRNRSVADAWAQWAVTFGNAQTNLIRVLKFNDLNQNQIQDAGEPVLSGWQFTLEIQNGASWTQINSGTTGSDGYLTFTGLAAGTYRVTEVPQTGWSNTTPLVQTVVIPTGSPTVVFPAVFGNVQSGSLTIHKTVVWNQVTPDSNLTFHICISGPSFPTTPSCQDLTDNGSYTWTNLIPGTYTVTENTGGIWVVQVTGDGVVTPGGTAQVEVTNTANQGNLIVHKIVDWNGSTPVNQTFTICISGPSYPITANTPNGDCKNISFTPGTTSGDLTWNNLIPGTYTVTEPGLGVEWTQVVSPVPPVPSDGTTVTATITNTRKLASLQVNKVVNWNGYDPIVGQTFDICISGPSYSTPNCKTFTVATLEQISQVSQKWDNLIPGSYTITETDPGNDWGVPTIVSSPVNVPIDGTTAIVTVTNTRNTPTAVTLLYFKVGSVNRDKVTLIWETAAEINNAGFNIYRSNQKDFATATLINTIPSKSNGAAGAKYAYTDQMPGSGRWYYWLVDIDTSGNPNPQMTQSQPVDVVPMDKFVYLPGINR